MVFMSCIPWELLFKAAEICHIFRECKLVPDWQSTVLDNFKAIIFFDHPPIRIYRPILSTVLDDTCGFSGVRATCIKFLSRCFWAFVPILIQKKTKKMINFPLLKQFMCKLLIPITSTNFTLYFFLRKKINYHIHYFI